MRSLDKALYLAVIIVLFSTFAVACERREPGEDADTELGGAHAYGFPAPGLEPELFAFEVFGNDAAQLAVAMSPSNDELFYSQLRREEDGISVELLRSILVNGEWSQPEEAPFSSEYGEIEAFFNSSGSRLYFFSRRPVLGATEAPSPWNLWFVEERGGGWGEARLLGQPDSLVVYNWSATLLNDSTLFFTARPYEEHGLAEIYEIPISSDVFGEPKSLGPGVNRREYTENEPAIAPDGRFLFFSSARREGVEMPDLYWVSTRTLEPYRSD